MMLLSQARQGIKARVSGQSNATPHRHLRLHFWSSQVRAPRVAGVSSSSHVLPVNMQAPWPHLTEHSIFCLIWGLLSNQSNLTICWTEENRKGNAVLIQVQIKYKNLFLAKTGYLDGIGPVLFQCSLTERRTKITPNPCRSMRSRYSRNNRAMKRGEKR